MVDQLRSTAMDAAACGEAARPEPVSAAIAGTRPISGAGQIGRERHASRTAEQMDRSGAGDRRQAQHEHADDAARAQLPAGSIRSPAHPARDARRSDRPAGDVADRGRASDPSSATTPPRSAPNTTPAAIARSSSGTSTRLARTKAPTPIQSADGIAGHRAESVLNGRNSGRPMSADDVDATATAARRRRSRAEADCGRSSHRPAEPARSTDAEPDRLVGIGGGSQRFRRWRSVVRRQSIADERVLGAAPAHR